MKKILIAFFALFATLFAQAQFYYKDIISNKQLLADMAAYKENKIKSINIKSFEDNGAESESFFCTKKIKKGYKKTELFTRADMAPASMFVSIFDSEGKLLSTNDSSSIIVKNMQYKYDDKKRIVSIFSTVQSKDEDFDNSITEEHIYKYKNNAAAELRIVKNLKDTTIILFSADAKGNIELEKNTKTGKKFYYYYDTNNLLTDIVPSSEDGKRLKPDYIFEYNSAGQIIKMTSVEEGSNNYFIWRYDYTGNLRTKEKCFTNERRLMGSIEYEYK